MVGKVTKKILVLISTLGLLYFVLNSLSFPEPKPTLDANFFICVFVAILLLFISIAISCWRWLMLLRAVNVPVEFSSLFSIYYISNTISTYIPGMLLGDYYRYRFLKEKTTIEGRRASISQTILIDRILSLFSLVINAYLFLIIFIKVDIIESSITSYLSVGLNILLIAIAFVYFFRKRIIKLLFFLEGLGGIKVYHIFQFINKNKLLILYLLPVSMIANYFVLACFHFITLAYDLRIDPIANSLSVILSFFGTLVPISPSGLGVSEYIYNEMYELITKDNINIIFIFLSFRVISFLINGPAFLLLLKYNFFTKK